MSTVPDPSAPREGEPRKLPPRFASVVAHELRNPLSAVKIALQTVGRARDLSDKDATRLSIALREVGTIERVLDLVIDWARPPELSPEPLPVSVLIDGALAFARPAFDEHRPQFRAELDEPLPNVRGDREHLPRALAEVVRNAAEASSEGLVSLQARAANGRVVLTVTDSGPALGDEPLQHVFEPFWSGRARGVGLGLSVARDVVERLGGTLRLERAEGAGQVATIELPAANGAAKGDGRG